MWILQQTTVLRGALMPFRWFVSFCGYPTTVISDCGTKLVATSKELEDTIKSLNQEQLTEYGAEIGM